MTVEVRRSADGLQLELTGDWGAQQFTAIAAALAAVDLRAMRHVQIATGGLTSLELSGAWALREFLQRARRAGVEVSFRGAPPDQLRLLEATLKEAALPAAAAPAPAERLPVAAEGVLAGIGRYVVGAGRDLFESLAFFGRVSVTLIAAVARARHLRPISVARHVFDTGITAMPIVALISFLISVVVAYLGAEELRGLGVDIYVVDLVTIGVLRELGVLLTAIVVAGRSGSAFAAEIGSMKLNDEVDALIATGVDPFEALVVPRVLGLIIALPLLTIIADLVGLAGGALLCRYLLDMPLTQYINRVNESISSTTFWVGMWKAPAFALLIAMSGCFHGMRVRSSARELGHQVTLAVVQAIFLVILADAMFAVLFWKLDV
jgi:phospholipid/cholesterol/gamma-HCH transport system permease protein